MGLQHMKWLGDGADVAVRAAFSLGMCGALAGFLYITAQNGMAESSSGRQAVPQAATVVATLDTGAVHSPAMPEAKPVAVAVPLKVSTPAVASAQIQTVIPTKRPDISPKASVAAAGNSVERFDKCLPNCETRDPMIVGQAASEPAPFDPNPQVDAMVEQPVSFPVLRSAGTLLDRALEVPGDAIRKGKSAITSVVRSTL